jgi:hypothetical protein
MTEKTLAVPSHGQQVLRRFNNYGGIGGLALGLICGLLVAGPRFEQWSVVQSLMIIAGPALMLGAFGQWLVGLMLGSIAGGGGAGTDGGYGEAGDADGGDACSDGGGGDC